MKIFILDDNPIITLTFARKAKKFFLETYPEAVVSIDAFHDPGAEFEQRMAESLPDVLILDRYIELADQSYVCGLDMLPHLVDPFPHLKVIMFSSDDHSDAMETYQKAGAYSFVNKGDEDAIAQLVEVIAQLRQKTRTIIENPN